MSGVLDMETYQLARRIRLVNWLYIASATLLGYDYILTLDREVRLIWFSPWSYTKFLFFLTRYTPIIAAAFLLHHQLFPDISRHMCNVTWAAGAWMLFAGINSCEAVLIIRTWAVWRRDYRVGFGLATLMVVTLIVQGSYVIKVVNSLWNNRTPVPHFSDLGEFHRGCQINSVDPAIFFANMVAFITIDTVILVLMVISAIRAYKANSNSYLWSIVHRDSLSFYAFLLCLVITEPIFMARKLDVSEDPGLFLMILTQSVVYSILTVRIIFNIRSAYEENVMPTELHTTLTWDFRSVGHHDTVSVLVP